MKKTLALIMALALVLCSASAFAAREKDAYSWAKTLPDGATFMFDYSRMQPVPAVKLGNLAWAEVVGEDDKGEPIYEIHYVPDLVTTSGDKEVVVDANGNAAVKTVVVNGVEIPVPVDFAHMSKAEIAYWNDRINSHEFDAVPVGGTTYDWPYPVSFDGTMDDSATDHDYTDKVETLQPGATSTFVDPVTGKVVARENDIIEATFTQTGKTTSTPYSLGVEYTYSTTAPDSKDWSAAEKSTMVFAGEEIVNGQTMYKYVNKEVSNTPAANVATTTNKTENYISTAFVAGFLKSELNPNGNSNQVQNVVPVDLTQDGTYVYPIVTKAHTIVGLVWATVEDGTVTIDGQLRDQVKRYGDDFTLKIYTSVDQLAKKGKTYEIGEAIAIEELGDAIFFEISGKVQYHWSIGASKVGGYSVYWTLQDYWRYETRWKLYRNALRDVADLVAAE
ncbi:MAG: hypothetical protein IJ174_04200 [Clostridia bacterium]|nr:hypothetical protein [Clostridia bacterium]